MSLKTKNLVILDGTISAESSPAAMRPKKLHSDTFQTRPLQNIFRIDYSTPFIILCLGVEILASEGKKTHLAPGKHIYIAP